MWAPPRVAKSTSWPVTALMTSGPVMKRWLAPFTWKTKSVMAGEYTAPPAQGPRITEIWGITPEARDVALEDLPVGVEGHHPLLDPGPARVLEADERGTVLHGQVHDLADLLAHGLAQAPAEHREVLGEHEGGAAVDGAPPGDHGVPGGSALLDAEPVGLVADQGVYLAERSRVEEGGEALPGGRLARWGALVRLRRLAPQFPQVLDAFLCAHAAPAIYPRPAVPLRPPDR